MQNKQTLVRLVISIPDQQLALLSPDSLPQVFPISSSRFGIGSEPGSFRTPIGSFRICEKFGDHAPPYLIFRSRLPTGEIASPSLSHTSDDLILSRILWLDGLDLENRNTKDRFIYLHGTNQESLIGSPASHGCIRMRNLDIIQLYDSTPTSSSVLISLSPLSSLLPL